VKSRAIGLLLAAGVATGVTGAASTAAANPWTDGVPEAQQDQANAIFEEGNQLFAQQAHNPALEKYRAALALWDHPLIRFNLAVTLIRLDRPLEAIEELERALRFGEDPFKKDLYQQAVDYQARIRGRVGHIEASCSQAGAQVLLDGKPWFSCPGSQKLRVMAGEHALVGQLAGYLTSAQRLIVAGGGTATEALKLVPLESVMVVKYRYPRWIPYTVVGAGVTLGLTGLATYLSGANLITEYETEFGTQCANGCKPGENQYLDDKKERAEFRGALGVSLMIAGGVASVGGAVLTILNRPQKFVPQLEVAPTAGGLTAGATFRF